MHLQGPLDIYNSQERAKGYKDALTKFGYIPDPSLQITPSGMTVNDGCQAAEELVAKGQPFDAVFAFTDTLAIGLMNRLRELGRRIPEEVAVASFSGTELSSIVYPQLTTVEPPLFEMGEKAAELILQQIKQPTLPNKEVILNAAIRIRASSL